MTITPTNNDSSVNHPNQTNSLIREPETTKAQCIALIREMLTAWENNDWGPGAASTENFFDFLRTLCQQAEIALPVERTDGL